MASLKSYTIGIETVVAGVVNPQTKVTFKLQNTQGNATQWTFNRDTALDIAARLIQAVTAIEPIDLAGIVREHSSG